MCQHATSLRSTGSQVIEWGGTWSEDDGGVGGGVALGWVFVAGAVLGFVCVRMVRGHVGVVRMSWEWVRIGDSLTLGWHPICL